MASDRQTGLERGPARVRARVQPFGGPVEAVHRLQARRRADTLQLVAPPVATRLLITDERLNRKNTLGTQVITRL